MRSKINFRFRGWRCQSSIKVIHMLGFCSFTARQKNPVMGESAAHGILNLFLILFTCFQSQYLTGVHAGKVAGRPQQLLSILNRAAASNRSGGSSLPRRVAVKIKLLMPKTRQKQLQFHLNPHSVSWCVSAPIVPDHPRCAPSLSP